VTNNDGPVTGFALTGDDHQFHWAQAEIQGQSVVVWCDQVSKPLWVRYAWGSNPVCNLFNKDGFSATPFQASLGIVSKPGK
jgi:sialate O-acetylesterase